MTATNHKLLQVEGLTVDFDAGKPTAHRALVEAILSISASEIVALTGNYCHGSFHLVR